jgi:hypothetical protein
MKASLASAQTRKPLKTIVRFQCHNAAAVLPVATMGGKMPDSSTDEPNRDADPMGGAAGFEFLKGHIAATMALIHGLIAQNALDRHALDAFFTNYLSELPHTRETLALRLVIDQWRQGLRDGQDEHQLRRHFLEVVTGGRQGE